VLQKVEACPAIEAGPGRVITATITHPHAEIYELRVTGKTATDPGTLMGSELTLMPESQRGDLCGVEPPSSRLDYSPSLRYTQPRMKTWMQSMMLGLMAMLMPVASGVQAASLPQDSQGSYSLVTHSLVQSQEEVAIQTTGAHPFLSKTRHAWVSARDLQAGEALRGQDGEELRVASLGRIPGAQPVFNLEVETEHVYFVSEAGVLVHNAYNPWKASGSKWKKKTIQGRKVYQRDDLINPEQMTTWTDNGVTVQGTNRERMATGRSPQTPDGRPVIIHHGEQTMDGHWAEISEAEHRELFRDLHDNTGSLPSSIDRSVFNRQKEEYWKRRADDF
jgi:A nuclease of the HNH/ENDO VII superfamily with conserved LHH/Pretoxin HINT domain